jgi:hypothetical protein
VRAYGALALLLLIATAGIAAAEDAVDESQRYRISLPDGVTADGELPAGTLARWTDGDRGVQVAIARVDYGNTPAWRGNDRFFTSVEAGVRSAARRYQRISSQRQRLGRVPALDLWFSRDTDRGPGVVATRFLFFRRYTLILTVTVDRGGYRRQRGRMETVVGSFEPYLGSPAR